MRAEQPAEPSQPVDPTRPMDPAESVEAMQPMEPTQPTVPESTVPLGQQAQWDDNPRAEDLLDHWNGADVLRVELEISNLSDNDIVDGINPLVRGRHSVGIYFWAMNLGYSLDYFTEAEHPTNWAEFWDVERFPGPRGLTSMDFEPPPLELPFLANGVAVEDLYPMDIDEGFELLSGFRDHITKWTGYSADATQLLVQGELAAAPGGNGSLTNAVNEGASVGMSWEQGLLYFDAWVMPKGAPHPENALRFIEFCYRPEVQADFVKRYPIAPVVAAATDLLAPEVAEVSLGNPKHIARQVPPNPEWWSTLNDDGKTNLELVYEKWATWIL